MSFPDLARCVGNVLLMQCGSDLIPINPPYTGFTVKYIKDILHLSHLYIRPLQRDIFGIKIMLLNQRYVLLVFFVESYNLVKVQHTVGTL